MPDLQLPPLNDLIALAWPDGAPPEELLARERLSPDRLEKLRRRLTAVLLWTGEHPGPRPAGVPAAAALAGTGVARFHAMVAGWRAKRSLAVFGLHASDKLNRVRRGPTGDREDLIARIARVLADDPSIGPAALRRRLVDEGVAVPAQPTLRVLLMEARRRLPPGPFGGRLLLDSVGLDLVYQKQRMRLFVALDAGTGLALGWADGTSRSRALGLAHAASDALGRLPGFDLGRFGIAAVEPNLDVRLQDDDAAGRRTFEGVFGPDVTARRGRAKLGSALIEALGPRLGRVWLGPGEREDSVGYRTGTVVHIPEYADVISIGIDAAIDRHNAERLALAVGPASGAAAVDETRSRVADLLRQVERCGDELQADGSYGRFAEDEE